MIKWEAFKHEGCEYDLSHLHPTRISYTQPAKENKPERIYVIDVCYGLHCFTDGEPSSGANKSLRYSDARETRSFSFERYETSKLLPAIIQELNKKACMHTGHGNFFIVEIFSKKGIKLEYEVYFDVKKSSAEIAHLIVNSAFVADGRRKRKQSKKISFYIILNNKLTNKPINPPK